MSMTSAEPPRKKNLMRSLRAAIFGGSGKMAKMPLPQSGSAISTIVGSARPLHVVDIGHSPERPGMESPASSVGGLSRGFCSSHSLFDLDVHKEEDEAEAAVFYDGVEEDEMIDVKAEEFIARFYQQLHGERQ